jgi:hypothetical protein
MFTEYRNTSGGKYLRLAYSCWSKQLSLNAIRSIYASTILITLKNNNHTVILCRSSKDKSIGRCSHDCILPHRCLPCGLLPLSFIAVTSFGSDVRLCPFCFVLLHLVQCCCSMSALYNFISPLRLGMSLTASCTSLVIPVCHSLGLHNNLLLSTFLPSPSFFSGHLPLLQIAQIHVKDHKPGALCSAVCLKSGINCCYTGVLRHHKRCLGSE